MSSIDQPTADAATAGPPPRAAGAAPDRAWWRRLSPGRYSGVLFALAVVCVYLAITEPAFGTWDNLMNVVKANSVLFVLAIGATFVIISAGIDLSVASATAASAMVLGLTLRAGWAAAPAIAVTILFGCGLGLLMGATISWLKISFLVVTLGGLSIFQSFALVVNDGATISVFGLPGFEPIRGFVNDEVLGLPLLLLFDVALLLVAGGVLRYTRFGRALFAVGSNPEAARLNGINVGAVLLAVYGIAGLTAGIAAIVQVGRLTGASPESDPTLLLTVITAVLIGGTAYTGGEGGVFGTLIGVLFLGVVQNGLTLSGVNTFWQGMVSGLILIGAVGLEVLRRRGRLPRLRRGGPPPESPPAAPAPAAGPLA